ncbi:MAG TPA: hypothetical protein VG934_00535 [Candidatus Paceibacterota bacterium]|nr:hypothetical protein [Candidatus Paceibacterota bacterium]
MTPEEQAKTEQEIQNEQEIQRIAKTPKSFSENVRVLFGEGHFVLTVYKGEMSESYVLTPHHTKRLSQLLSFQISEYERQNGEIPAMLDLRIPSPFQNDLQGPKSDGESKQDGKDKPGSTKK